MLLALFEADSEVWDDVFVILEEFSEQLGVLFFVLARDDVGEVVEDVESADVELVDSQDGRVAAHNEGQGAEPGDAVSDADRQLLVQVLGTAL